VLCFYLFLGFIIRRRHYKWISALRECISQASSLPRPLTYCRTPVARHSTAFVAKETCRMNGVVKGRVNREMKERCMAVLLCYKIVSNDLSVSVDEEV
jgi:hypothetical protein